MENISSRVLVVDDNQQNVRLLTAYLTNAKYTVITAEDGEQALRLVLSESPDIILLDVMMPKLDGFQVCKTLKNDPATRLIPIIIITALEKREDKIRGIEAGADDFVTKPFDDQELMLKVKSLLHIKQLHDDLSTERNELRAFDNINLSILQDFDLDRTLTIIVNECRNLLNCDRVTIYLVEENKLISRVALGTERVQIELKIGEGIAGRVAQTKIPYFTNTPYQDYYFNQDWDKKIGYKTDNILAVPVVYENQILGVLQSLNKKEGFSNRDKEIAVRLAQQIGISLTKIKLEEGLRSSENKFRNVVENLGEGIWVLNENEETTYANPVFEKLTSYFSKELLGKKASDLMDEDNYQQWLKKKSTELSNFQIHLQLKNRRGELIYVSIHSNPQYEDIRYIGSINIVFDLRKQKEIEIRQRELEQMKKDLSSMMIHDLRNPMVSIMGYTELLLQGAAGTINEKQKDYLQRAYQSSGNMLQLINDFMDIAKLEAGKMELEQKPFNVQSIVDSAIRLSSGFAEKKKIKLLRYMAPNLPLLKIDPDKMERVVTNLLTNAIKFTAEKGEIRIRVAQEIDTILAEVVKVSVIDNGEGIPEEDLPFIFEKYRRGKQKEKSSKMGTGLGLAICRLIIETHGGRIWVESTLGKGSQFHFILPVNQK